MGKRGTKPRSVIARFWAKVDKHGPEVRPGLGHCWLWTGGRNVVSGYGAIHAGGRLLSTHRVSWTIHRGPIPQGLGVLHRCDNPPCVNPEHLFLGNDADNTADKCAKGRHRNHGGMFGTSNPAAKLTEEAAAAIRARYAAGGVGQRALAADYGVSPFVVWKIVNDRAWTRAA